ncbi:DUF4157 domain-containing protein [Deinococcus sp. HMF7604]|uniref:eCIS core domain-containing protein n=1 Tax=Deinococcus betulae TaxID=2873312 RepID=UPI001CC9CA57|nr:DUF4157 domain-containing protein [Deinococcus betulae]MBZ9751508.1 DUF4157 domain-containing protein [Deinococcus betulae]
MTFNPKKPAPGTAPAVAPFLRNRQQDANHLAQPAEALVTPVPFGLSNSRSASAPLQRAQVAPVWTAASLLAADQTSIQRAAAAVQAGETAVRVSADTLAARGLCPSPASSLQRHRPADPPVRPALSPLQRQALTDTGRQTVTAALTRDARYIPGAVRAELAVDALQRAVAQGADGAALHTHIVSLAMASVEQQTVQRALQLQRQREASAAMHREDYTLQVVHQGLQRQLAEAQAQHAEATLGTVTERVRARQGGGELLPASVQRHLEVGLNADLSRVRIHTDGEAAKLAASVQAEAFTTGQDIYFAANRYDPNSPNGLKLLAHEATHTVQQAQGKVQPGLDPDAALEAQAQQMGERLATLPSTSVPSSRTPTVESALARSAVQRSVSPVFQRKTAPPTAAGVVAALRQPGPAQAIIASALNQNLPDEFWTDVMASGSQKYGREWADAALKKLPAPIKAKLTLALLGGEQELTYAAFVNQLAYLVYSNDPSLSDSKQIPGNTAKSAQGILQAGGYQAHPTIQGYWGFQMRVFTPIKGHPSPVSKKTIVAFRGSEGVMPNPLAYAQASQDPKFPKQNESGLDTMTDLAAYHTGYSQYEVNEKQIIGPVLKAYSGDLVATGHSLGGALAQIAVVKNPSRFSEVYTFQGANIKKSDVEKLAAMKKVKARHYRVTADAVPSSGEKGIPGQVYEFDRKAGTAGLSVNWRTGQTKFSPDASDGHNAPILLEVLQDLQGQGLAKNALAQNLVKNGSQDPNELGGFNTQMPLLRTVPSALDTTPGKEGLKQAVTGVAFLPQFQTTYENNVIYNILLEQTLPLLQQITVQSVKNAAELVRRLTAVGAKVETFKLAHTPQSLKMLEVIYAGPQAAKRAAVADYKAKLKTSQNMAISPYNPQVLKAMEAQYEEFVQRKQRFIELDIPQKILDENLDRLTDLGRLLDLWYTVHPSADALFSAARSLSTTPRAR